MSELQRLTEDGRRLITEEFLRGDLDYLPEDDVAQYTETVDVSNEVVELRELDRILAEIRREYDRFEPDIDAAAAAPIHRCLRISRRVASDPGVWHYLAAVRYPDFVRHRWEYNTKRAMTEKFLAGGQDIYSNALHRLWWIAELTYDESRSSENSYDLTERVLENQTLANRIFDREFARYKPAAVACTEALVDEPTEIADKTTLRFSHALTNFQLEGLIEDELYEIITRIREEVREEI